MSFYPVKIPWTTKPPPGTPIDWEHPLTQGLICVHDFTDGAGLPFDGGLSKRNATALTSVAYGVKAGEYAVGQDLVTAGTRGIELGQTAGMLTGISPYTIVARVLPVVFGGSNRYVFSFNTYDAAWGFNASNVPIVYDSASKTFTGGSGPAVDEWADVAWVRNSINTGGTYFYKNGIVSGAAVTHSDSFPAITSARWLADSPAMTYRFYGWISYGRVYNRALSAAELLSLKSNPWQIYQPRTVWVPVAAGGGTTYEAALTLAAAGGFSGAANAVFSAAVAFAATGGLSDGANADYAAAWSATATAALIPGGAATMLAALTLTGTTGITGSAAASFAATAEFPAVAGVAASYGSIVMAALALEAIGGMTATMQAQYEAAITAVSVAGITPQAAAILSASFQAAVVAALAASTSGMEHFADLALPCTAALSATNYAELAAALTLATGATVDASALATMFAGVSFPVLAALAATHPDDIASAMRVVVMFQTASASIGFTTKSPKVTIQ